MNATFRLRKAILIEGLMCATFFTAACCGYGLLFFLDNPKAGGFKDARAASSVGILGITIFGTMLLLSIYTVIAYFVEQFSISGTTFRIRSVFQHEQFDASSIQQLIWNAKARDGKLTFRSISGKAVLRLHGFTPEDRVSIIRIVRFLVHKEVQVGWDEFCHFVALPLREGRNSRQPGGSHVDPMSLPESARVFITRQRYDRMAIILTPTALVLGFVAWWITGFLPSLLVAPSMIPFWLLMRSSIPKEGQWSESMLSSKRGRVSLLAACSIPASGITVAALQLFGLSKDSACMIGLFILVPWLPILLHSGWQHDKERRATDLAQLPASLARWNAFEAAPQNP